MKDNDPINKIHKIREEIYEEVKDLSKDEFIKLLNKKSEEFIQNHPKEKGINNIDELFLKLDSKKKAS